MPADTIDKLLPPPSIVSFAERWSVAELALFGSALTQAFSEKSDLDILIRFKDGVSWGLFEMLQMQEDLEKIAGRSVDLVSKRAIEQSANALRRSEILGNAKVFYEAR